MARLTVIMTAAALLALPSCGSAKTASTSVRPPATVWLCRPGAPHDPCAVSLQTTVEAGDGVGSVVEPPSDPAPRFDCFYVYPTVSRESQTNADLEVQQAETDTAQIQAAPFSAACRVWSPVYRQVTMPGLVRLYEAGPGSAQTRRAYAVAYDSLQAAFEDYLKHYNDGRPIVILAHSQGAILTIDLLQRLVDRDPGLRSRLAMAIILGGNLTVAQGSRTGGSFSHLPLCDRPAQAGCVIAYSSFPSQPPANAYFGYPRPVPGGQPQKHSAAGDLEVACVNPAALSGWPGALQPWFPVGVGTFPVTASVSTPWVAYPGLYSAACEQGGGASWLQVTPIAGSVGGRPLITESKQLGPQFGFHVADVNLAMGNLIADVAATERAWPR